VAKYDVCRDRDLGAFLLDVQTDFLHHLNSRAVVPMLPPDRAPKPARRLNPVFEIDGHDYVMVTQFISAVSAAELASPVANLKSHQDEITAALDMLFTGI
jgi:toxin CcdB